MTSRWYRIRMLCSRVASFRYISAPAHAAETLAKHCQLRCLTTDWVCA